MFNNAIGAAASAKDKSEINENDTLDSLTSRVVDVLTCLTCGEIHLSDTTISRIVECPRCQEVTTAPTEVEDE
jgi:rubrerythrin